MGLFEPFLPSKTSSGTIDGLIKEFGIDVNSTEPIHIPGLKRSTRIFKVNRPDLIEDLYIIDTPEGRDMACHPHIVGRALEVLCLRSAAEAAKAICRLTEISKTKNNSIVFEHVLRAAPAYRLHDGFRKSNPGIKFNEVWVRPRYKKPSYRNHGTKALEIIFENFKSLPSNENLIVFKPDTEATGRSGQIAMETIVKKCGEVGSEIDRMILYGFVASPGLKVLKKTAKKHGIKLSAFAVGNITDLAYNKYDMTVYGPDESFWRARGRIRKLGSIIDRTTLESYLPHFVPGSDQPGDWSSRQSVLSTGTGTEGGNIEGHLQNSAKLIKNLREISKGQSWYSWQDRIVENELRLLQATIKRYGG